jgi:hypothetical protein
MSRVDIGDGGLPIDIPDQWLPDWHTHVRAAIERGRHERALTSARSQLIQGLAPVTVARRVGLPRREVDQLAAWLRGPPGHLITIADERHILDHPLPDENPDYRFVEPSQWPTNRNPPHRIRILHAGTDPPTGSAQLPEYRLTITVTPIEDRCRASAPSNPRSGPTPKSSPSATKPAS